MQLVCKIVNNQDKDTQKYIKILEKNKKTKVELRFLKESAKVYTVCDNVYIGELLFSDIKMVALIVSQNVTITTYIKAIHYSLAEKCYVVEVAIKEGETVDVCPKCNNKYFNGIDNSTFVYYLWFIITIIIIVAFSYFVYVNKSILLELFK